MLVKKIDKFNFIYCKRFANSLTDRIVKKNISSCTNKNCDE